MPLNKSVWDKRVLDLRLFKGSLKDFSSYNQTTSIVGSPYWTKGEKCSGLFFPRNTTAQISVSDDVSLQLTEGTIVVVVEPQLNLTSSNKYTFVSKKDVGGTNYDFYYEAGNLVLHDGTTASSLALDISDLENATFISVTFENGEVPSFFVDGFFVGNGGSSLTITVDDADIIIGNQYTGTSDVIDRQVNGSLIFPEILTSDEISKLYQWTTKLHTPEPIHRKLISMPPRYKPSDGCILDVRGKIKAGKLIDHSGQGNHGVNHGVDTSKGIFDKGLRFDGSQYVDISALTSTNKSYTFSWVQKISDISDQDIFDNNSTSNRLVIISITGSKLAYYDNGIYRYCSTHINNGLKHHVAFVLNDTTNKAQFYVDGETFGSELGYTGSVSLGFAYTTLGAYFDGSRYFINGTLDSFRIYEKVFSAAEIKADYRQMAKIRQFNFNPNDYRVTIANQTSGKLSNTPWQISTGSWAIEDDDEKGKAIVCKGSGIIYIDLWELGLDPKDCSYGGWGIEFIKADATALYCGFISDDLAVTNGYKLRFTINEEVSLTRYGPTGFLTTTDTAYFDHSNWYNLTVTRDTQDEFTSYIKGGSFSNWTQVDSTGGSGSNPVTDSTHTEGRYIVLDLDADDKIGKVYKTVGAYKPI